MTTRQEWINLSEEYLDIRARVKKIGYELDALHSKATRASADLSRLSLAGIDSAAALTNDLSLLLILIVDRGLASER